MYNFADLEWRGKMIDVECPNPKCRRVYHAELSQVGRQIKCTNPACDSLIPIIDSSSSKMVEREPLVPNVSSPNAVSSSALRWRLRPKRIFTSPAFMMAAASVITIAAVCLLALRPARPSVVSSFDPSTLTAIPSTQSSTDTLGDQKPAVESAPPAGSAEDVKSPPYSSKGHPWDSVSPYEPPRIRRKLPTAAQDTVRPSLPNCARFLSDAATEGRGQLNVDNRQGTDAEVVLYDPGLDLRLRDFNVSGGANCQIAGIPPGHYELKFCQGSSFWQFEGGLTYEQTSDENARYYDEISVTLYPVESGNARRKPISRQEFLRGRPGPESASANQPTTQ